MPSSRIRMKYGAHYRGQHTNLHQMSRVESRFVQLISFGGISEAIVARYLFVHPSFWAKNWKTWPNTNAVRCFQKWASLLATKFCWNEIIQRSYTGGNVWSAVSILFFWRKVIVFHNLQKYRTHSIDIETLLSKYSTAKNELHSECPSSTIWPALPASSMAFFACGVIWTNTVSWQPRMRQ